jgi:hypothetical protein
LIGNDVVDLFDPETAPAALHPRFDARVFSSAERARLDAAPDRARLRWALWAAKEAAYKAARRLDTALPFHPRRFDVDGDVVWHRGRPFPVRVRESGDALHAVAVAEGEDPGSAAWGLAEVAAGSAAGDVARALALAAAARRLGVRRSALAVGRAGRMPVLLLRGVPCPALLSLSHHGRYAAFALHVAGGRA